MPINKDQGHPTLSGAGVTVAGQFFHVPGYSLFALLGEGANAAVFQGRDNVLKRDVAIKVWNARGTQRALSEAAKIAGFNHPHIVATYHFGHLGGHPYCVMEYVPGESAKSWLKKDPPLTERLKVWEVYSSALKHIHAVSAIHGDPHVGNILVSAKGAAQSKISDAGTSEFWNSHAKIEAREATLIHETAGRIFAPESFARLWRHPNGLNHKLALEVLDAVARYLDIVYGLADYDARSVIATTLAELVLGYPFFDLETVMYQVSQTGITSPDRLGRRLNAMLQGISDLLEANDELDQKTFDLYAGSAARVESDFRRGHVDAWKGRYRG